MSIISLFLEIIKEILILIFRSTKEAISLLKPVYLHLFLEKCKLKHSVAKFLLEIILKSKNLTSNKNIIELLNLYVSHLTVFTVFLLTCLN